MTSVPSFAGKELIRILARLGFEVIRIKGSHHFLRHPDGRTTIIPVHRNETIGPGLLNKIAKDCELTIRDLTEKR